MDINEKIERLRLIYEILQLDLIINEYEQKMKDKDGPRECNKADSETP